MVSDSDDPQVIIKNEPVEVPGIVHIKPAEDSNDSHKIVTVKETKKHVFDKNDHSSCSGAKETPSIPPKLNLSILPVVKLEKFAKEANFSRFCERFIEHVYLNKIVDENLYLYFLQHVDDDTYSMLDTQAAPQAEPVDVQTALHIVQ